MSVNENLYLLLDIRKSFYLINYYNSLGESSPIFFLDQNNEHKIYLKSLRGAFPNISFESVTKINIKKPFNNIVLDFASKSESINSLLKKIKHKDLIVLLNPNIGIYDNLFSNYSNIKYIFWNKKLFKHLKKERNSSLSNSKIDFKNYFAVRSLIKMNSFDVLIFMPSRMNFSDQTEYFKFLKKLRLRLIPYLGEKIFIKHHQADINSYSNANFNLSFIAKSFSFFLSYSFIESVINIIENRKIHKFLLLMYLSKIEKKYNIKKLPYPNINIEFYLKSVDTIIGGFSNTLFFASFFNKNIILLNDYIPDTILKQGEKFETKNFLKTNMEFFLKTEKKYFFSRDIFNEN